MSDFKAIIIEDEKPAARRLNRMLGELDIVPEAMLHSVQESVDYLLNNDAPDLIFLDIQLSDGLSFEIFDQVDVKSAIIFTTAYDEYALQAFKLNSIDYLLKPIDEDELKIAVEQFVSRFRESENNNNKAATINFDDIAKLLGNPVDRKFKKRYTAKVGEHLKLFHTEDIQLFFSENKGTYLHIDNGRNYLIDTKLEALENELDPEKFFRISRQAIIHVNAIDDMISYTNSRLQIKIKTFKEMDLIVSRERVKDFKSWLER
ncbi:LytTR family two component transcriptional regulator [Nonlabens dokdonensis]|uniref:Two component system response regulator n=2 Tax=Nonlabens dokdonensis TaxID=328515 RepID=L7WEB5_NONDD|nr:LytTR family DNA-binding domain-containing protein [Nonlabens dokdonensis]AGC78454.1 two component system response regulator [Nonlabens dokdonensis DSW-6]PZX38199.1 LytTR family two component transcriptional regulator [Nonlabens dokdonensis]